MQVPKIENKEFVDQMIKVRREDLKKYYKYILYCAMCKEHFGSDTGNSTCPVCLAHLNGKTSRLKRIILLNSSKYLDDGGVGDSSA